MNEQTPQDDFELMDWLKKKTPNPLVALAVGAIAIGQFNDTIDMSIKFYETVMSSFTDGPSKDRLSKIYIRAASSVLEETLGAPVYIKSSQSGQNIRYYKDPKFILSAVTSNDTIDAFLVFPNSDFKPNTIEHAGGDGYLNKPFSQVDSALNSYANIARSGNYYIEENDGGRYQLLYTSVGGYSEYLSDLDSDNLKRLATFHEQHMMEEDTTKSLADFREHTTPNFYGYSTIGLEFLEKAILTKLEYELLTN